MSERRTSRRDLLIAGGLAAAGAAIGLSRSCEDDKRPATENEKPAGAAPPTVSKPRESLIQRMHVDSGADGLAGKSDAPDEITEIKSEPLGETEVKSREVLRNAQAYLQGVSRDGIDIQTSFDVMPSEVGPIATMDISWAGGFVAQMQAIPGEQDKVKVVIINSLNRNLTRGFMTPNLTQLRDLIQEAVDSSPKVEEKGE